MTGTQRPRKSFQGARKRRQHEIYIDDAHIHHEFTCHPTTLSFRYKDDIFLIPRKIMRIAAGVFAPKESRRGRESKSGFRFHRDTDLRHDHLGREAADAGNGFQHFDGYAKGFDVAVDLLINAANGSNRGAHLRWPVILQVGYCALPVFPAIGGRLQPSPPEGKVAVSCRRFRGGQPRTVFPKHSCRSCFASTEKATDYSTRREDSANCTASNIALPYSQDAFGDDRMSDTAVTF